MDKKVINRLGHRLSEQESWVMSKPDATKEFYVLSLPEATEAERQLLHFADPSPAVVGLLLMQTSAPLLRLSVSPGFAAYTAAQLRPSEKAAVNDFSMKDSRVSLAR